MSLPPEEMKICSFCPRHFLILYILIWNKHAIVSRTNGSIRDASSFVGSRYAEKDLVRIHGIGLPIEYYHGRNHKEFGDGGVGYGRH